MPLPDGHPDWQKVKLYGYWRSSASWRLRWAFNLKKISYQYIPVNLLKAEHSTPEYLQRSPAGTVPTVELNTGLCLVESLPIMELLDESIPAHTALYPKNLIAKAQVKALCEIINSFTQPIQTPRVMKFYSGDQAKRNEWARHWNLEGLKAFERAIAKFPGAWAFGDTFSAADICLIPQVYNARRFNIDVAQECPRIDLIYTAALKTAECLAASPEKQPDATP